MRASLFAEGTWTVKDTAGTVFEGELRFGANGVSQAPAITGLAIRLKPHDSNPAGLVASFIAVKAS